MKKLLFLLFVFTLVACGGSDEDIENDEELFLEKYDGTSWILRNIVQPSGADREGEIVWEVGRQFEIHSGRVFLTDSDCYQVNSPDSYTIVSHTETEFVWERPFNENERAETGQETGRSSLYIENEQLIFNLAYAWVTENQLHHIMDRVGNVECNPN